eukprot:gene3649-4191_t
MAQGDITDYDSLVRAIPIDCDVVFHVAAFVGMANSKELYASMYHVNVEGTANVVEACLKNNVRRIVYTSTIGTFTDGVPDGVVITEETRQDASVHSTSGYVRTKFLGEKIVVNAMDRGLQSVVLYPSFIIGRYDRDNLGAIAQFVSSVDSPFAGSGGGAFCDGEEVALAHIVAGERSASGSRYILGGHNLTWKQVIESMLKQYNRDNQVNVISRFKLVMAVRLMTLLSWFGGEKPPGLSIGFVECISTSFKVDSSKAARDLGFKNKSIDEMTKACVDWLKENPEQTSSSQ